MSYLKVTLIHIIWLPLLITFRTFKATLHTTFVYMYLTTLTQKVVHHLDDMKITCWSLSSSFRLSSFCCHRHLTNLVSLYLHSHKSFGYRVLSDKNVGYIHVIIISGQRTSRCCVNCVMRVKWGGPTHRSGAVMWQYRRPSSDVSNKLSATTSHRAESPPSTEPIVMLMGWEDTAKRQYLLADWVVGG